MDSQAEYLESSGGSDLFRNVVTGEKVPFITYPVRFDAYGNYRMDDKALVTTRDADGREERWWIQYVPVTQGLPYSARIWQELACPAPKMPLGTLLLGAIVMQLFQMWVMWLWLKG